MDFTPEIRKATNHIYQKISKVVPEIEWSTHAPYIYKINQLKYLNYKVWCGQRDLNSHRLSLHGPQPCLSTNFSMAATHASD